MMNDQTFHTPSFGDEEFNITSMHGQHAASTLQNSHLAYSQAHHPAPQVGMINPAQDGLAPPGGAPSYQQPLYLQEPHTPVTTHRQGRSPCSGAGAPAGNYMIQQQPGGQQRLLMMQPTQTLNGPPTPTSPTQGPMPQMFGRSPQRASPPGTTSDDSDDSVPSHQSQLPGDAESLLPIHYCSASRQQHTSLHQIGLANSGIKRSSPEPMDSGINRGQLQKKPKVQKKKKKRDPNEPQKPVSAYALFFRDTQAAIKGQNPNASFGEVSKIVASMWDGLDSEHKSVYKQKTEVAKKEYLKALAAYRASLVSKGAEQDNQTMYNHASNSPNYQGAYYPGANYGNGHSPQNYAPTSVPQGYTPQNYQSGQPPPGYGPSQNSQGYQASGQSPHQNSYPTGQAISPQSYQAIPNQSPQSYQENPISKRASPPQGYQSPVSAQSPRGYQGAQSPQNYTPNTAVSPQAYRTAQSPTTTMPTSHAMQYHHHTQQIQQQVHQVHQYQQQSQQQQAQQQPNIEQTSNNNSNTGIPQQSPDSESRSTPSCIRQGCTNPAIANSEWEDEYCSNECVVSHCRDVFSSWVASNSNSIQNFSAVK